MFRFVLFLLYCTGYIRASWYGWNMTLEWWQDTVIYQVYPSSFKDSDGDGFGDLKGIEEKLDHFVETGIKTIWLSPIFKSPMADLGYDVSDFLDVDPLYGTMEDFRNLMRSLKKRDLRILMDFVPNHSSDEHEWFQRSIDRVDPYTDYYIWKDGKKLQNGSITYPNNWLSLFGGSAWQWVEKRGQFYFHQFNVKQPDLNLVNPLVQQEMENTMKFWLDEGVNGFRMDAVKHLFEDPEMHDEIYINPEDEGSMEYLKMYHNYTIDWPDSFEIVYKWRAFLDNYTRNSSDQFTRVMLTEAYPSYGNLDTIMPYYGNYGIKGAHTPFNFLLMELTYESNATEFQSKINSWLDEMPKQRWLNWVTGNHDNHRVATRLGPEMVDAFYMLSLLLPGTAVTYQGEELGQPDSLVRQDQIKDPNNNGHGAVDFRDPQRGPFLWDGSENAGFTTNKFSYEPIYPSYWEINLEAQKATNNSHYNIYKRLVSLRSQSTLKYGKMKTYVVSTWVFAFTRTLEGSDSYLIVMNVGSEREVIILSECIPFLPQNLTVYASSLNSGYKTGDVIISSVTQNGNNNPLILTPKASVVLKAKNELVEPTPSYSPTTNSSSSLSTFYKYMFLVGLIVVFSKS